MSFDTLKINHVQSNAVAFMGETMISVKDSQERVLLVSPMHGKETSKVERSDARFYLSPLVAKTAFDDISKGANVSPAFAGRTYDEMQAHLLKNLK